MSRLSERLRFALDRASRLEQPQFGQFALWVVLAAGLYALSQISAAYAEVHGPRLLMYAFYLPIEEPERHTWVSFLSFLPFRSLHSPTFFRTCVIGYQVSAALWALQLAGRWSGLAAAVFYTAALSLFWEHGAAVAEWWNLVSVVLILFAGWYWHHSRQIREALRGGEFWRRELFPVWARDLAVFSVAWFFFQAGASKLLMSGPSWADGTNLQLAVHRFVIEWNELLNPFVLFILRNRTYATLLSAGVLVLECCSLFAILYWFYPRLRFVRYLIGLGLTGFLCGVFALFGRWNFETTFVLVILFLWPLDRWIPAVVRGVRRLWSHELCVPVRGGFPEQVLRELIGRVDYFGRVRCRRLPPAARAPDPSPQ